MQFMQAFSVLLSFLIYSVTGSEVGSSETKKGSSSIDQFYKTTIERQAEESDSEPMRTYITPPPTPSRLSRGFADRRINPKGVVIDSPSNINLTAIITDQASESKRFVATESPEQPANEPIVHESYPESYADTRSSRSSFSEDSDLKPHVWSFPQDRETAPKRDVSEKRTSPISRSSYSMSSQSHSQSSRASREDKSDENDSPMIPDIPKYTDPKLDSNSEKKGQASTRQYFYNSAWVPKNFTHSPVVAASESSPFHETRKFNKLAERGDEMLLVFAHSSE